MSTLNVTNISDGTNTTSTTDVVKGSAKAWVSFDGTTNTGGNCDILESYNVSSVTDITTGTYQVNFTTTFEDINYTWALGNRGNAFCSAEDDPETTHFQIRSRLTNGTNSAFDGTFITATFFR